MATGGGRGYRADAMVQKPEKRPATYDDIVALPENMVGEIIGGELHASPRPAPKHANAASDLGAELRVRFGRPRGGDGPGGWIILDEPELHLGEHVLVPDIAGWRRERVPRLPEEAWFTLAPNWVCEVLSPSTAGVDRVRKMPIYAEHQVAHVWLVDPLERTLEVFRREADGWLVVATHLGDEDVRAEPFEDIAIRLIHLWSD